MDDFSNRALYTRHDIAITRTAKLRGLRASVSEIDPRVDALIAATVQSLLAQIHELSHGPKYNAPPTTGQRQPGRV